MTASTQVAGAPAGTFTIANEDRFRARPVSGGRPTATLELAGESGDGPYWGVAGQMLVTRSDSIGLLGWIAYAGLARKIGNNVAVDIGVINRFYGQEFNGGFNVNFVEVHAGWSGEHISSRISVSPSYYGTGRRTVYLETDATVPLQHRLTLSGHLGALLPLNTVARPGFARRQYDWRIGLAHPIGRTDAQVSWVSAGPRPDIVAGRPRGRGALVIALTYGF